MKLFRKRFNAKTPNREQPSPSQVQSPSQSQTLGSFQRNTNGSSSSNTPSVSSSVRTFGSITSQSDSVEVGFSVTSESIEETFSAQSQPQAPSASAASAPNSNLRELRPSYVKRGAKVPFLSRQKATCSEPLAIRSAPASQRSSTETETQAQGNSTIGIAAKQPSAEIIDAGEKTGSHNEAPAQLLAQQAARAHKLSIQFPIYASLTPQPDRRNLHPTRKISSVESRQTSASACTLAVPTTKNRSSSLDDSYQTSQAQMQTRSQPPSQLQSLSQSSEEDLHWLLSTANQTLLPSPSPGAGGCSPSAARSNQQLLGFGGRLRVAALDLPDICIHCVHEHHYQRKLRRQKSAHGESMASSDEETQLRDELQSSVSIEEPDSESTGEDESSDSLALAIAVRTPAASAPIEPELTVSHASTAVNCSYVSNGGAEARSRNKLSKRNSNARRKASSPAPPNTLELGILSDTACDVQTVDQVDSLTLHVPDVRRISSMTDLAKPAVVQRGFDNQAATSQITRPTNVDLNNPTRSKSVDVRMRARARALWESSGCTSYDHSLSPETRSAITAASAAAAAAESAAGKIPDSRLLRPEHAECGYKTQKAAEIELKSHVDWTDTAVCGEHLWSDTNVSIDFCYVGDADCQRKGGKKKCVACKIVIHQSCAQKFQQINFRCKPTFREAGLRNYRESGTMRHHWVHQRRQEQKCKQCGKSFQQKFPFGAKEIIAISCSWCKVAYHNKVTCFMMQQIEEKCMLGVHASIIVPPHWIIKLPKTGSLKSSLRRKSAKNAIVKRKRSKKDQQVFMIKPIPNQHMKPLLVFVNPKSGGNDGYRVLHKLYWLLNPRQVFDLSQCGPRKGLELYGKVPNLRILACGGDGTVGWILSTIDKMGISPCPPVAILPLGTGNDLARTLNWGGAYTDEPLSKILCAIEEGPVVQLDRWEIKVAANPDAVLYQGESGSSASASEEDQKGLEKLPIDEFNNYFSLGADAQVALEFHESREANPEKFNSRIKNKIFYAGAGGKFLVKRAWRDFGDYIRLECDDQDFTEKVRHLRLHCLLFLNIPRYGAGCTPWGNPVMQHTDDGLIEVIGLTAASLAAVQVGGHGERICQCSSVRLTTYKTIPVQVDGEPCRLAPSIVTITRHCQVNMVRKPKHRSNAPLNNELSMSAPERLRLQVSVTTMADYETLNYDKDKLKGAALPLGIIVVDSDADLESVRLHINRIAKDSPALASFGRQSLSENWCFLDSTTAERFFRIDPSQEQLHYVTDISSEDVYILDYSLARCNKPCVTTSVAQDSGHTNAAISASNASDSAQLANQVDSNAAGNCEAQSIEQHVPSIKVQPPKQTVTPGDRDTFTFQQIADSLQQLAEDCKGQQEVAAAVAIVAPPRPPLPPQHAAAANLSASDSGIDDGVNGAVLSESRQLERAFFDAAKRGDIKAVAALVNDGVDWLTADEDGLTCLHHAARFGHRDLVRFALDRAPKCIIDFRDREKCQTALHKAVWNQRRVVCRLLVAAGASLSARDRQNMTPRMLAVQSQDWELAAYLHSVEHVQFINSNSRETAV